MANTNHEDNTKNKGSAAPTTNPQTNNAQRNFKDNSTSNQCLKILDWLWEKRSITTTQAREHLDIMSPAARILQLRKKGYQIIKINDSWTSGHGINHRGVARYVLTQNEPLECANDREVKS